MSRRRDLKKASELPPIDLNPRRDPPLDFPVREFGELAPQDYATLGFLCGLEVHQQLNTARKLFCRCPAGVRTERVDAQVLRHMRPTLSEMGDYDGCALMEFKTKKEIVYLLEHGTVCTYELDDTPPFEIDPEAVKIALTVSRLFDLQLVSELQVMRKQYLDGSIPTGFQRTAMVGIGGAIPFRGSELGADRMLRIRQLTLEEDSCREVSDVGHTITFRTDRLGMPLIETVTEPDLLTPRDVAVGGRLLAHVAQASGRLRRGPGAGRQDVNVSIAGSRRVEIKGTCRHRDLPRIVHVEAYRHLELLRIQQALRDRGLSPALLQGDGLHADVTSLLGHCGYRPIYDAVRAGQRVRAVRLPGFKGLLAHRTQPGLRFDHEFRERVRVIACLTGEPFLLAADVNRDALPDGRWQEIDRAVGADRDDSVVLVWGDAEDAETAAIEVLLRAEQAFRGVPSETRQPHRDGTTGFERILPGPERMYPDTDTPQYPIPDRWVTAVEADRPDLPWEREERFATLGLPTDLAQRMAVARWSGLFAAVVPDDPALARRLAYAFETRIPHAWREAGHQDLPGPERIRPLVEALGAGRLHPSGTTFVLDRLLREDTDPGSIVAQHEQGNGVAPGPAPAAAAHGRARADRGAALRRGIGLAARGRRRGAFDPVALRDAVAGDLPEGLR